LENPKETNKFGNLEADRRIILIFISTECQLDSKRNYSPVLRKYDPVYAKTTKCIFTQIH
jgi:hypothetical protein